MLAALFIMISGLGRYGRCGTNVAADYILETGGRALAG